MNAASGSLFLHVHNIGVERFPFRPTKEKTMRKWLVLASHDESGSRMDHLDNDPSTLERVAHIISGDGEKPMEGDITEALGEFAEGGEFLFVPLDGDSFSGKVTITPRVDVVWEGNYV